MAREVGLTLEELEPYLVMLPGPTNVPHRVIQAMTTPIVDHRGEDFKHLLARLQEKLKPVFMTEGETLILTASGTGGVEAALQALVRSGDRVAVTVFGEFGGRAADFAEAMGAKVVRVEAAPGEVPPPKAVEESCRGGVKAIVAIVNETSTGVRIPWMAEVADIAHRQGAFFLVDAVSLLAGDDLPVDRLGIDICVTASQKCLAAPPGLAPLSLSDRAKRYVLEHPPLDGYFNLRRYLHFAEMGQTPYTPALPLFYALDEALNLVLAEGLEKRIRRHRACAAAFYSAFEAMGLKPLAKREVRSNTVLTLEYPSGLDDKRFRSILTEQHRVLVAGGFGQQRGKVFRVGSMGEVSSYHVHRTITAVSATLQLLGHRHDGRAAFEAAQGVLDREPVLAVSRTT